MRPFAPPPLPVDRPAAASRRRHRHRPSLERCEARALMTTYTVTALTDSGSGHGTAGDLRYCIERADADGQRDTIRFATAGTIQLGSALPAITSGHGLTIAGPGADQLTIGGGGTAASFTMLRVREGARATISGLTMADGHALQLGGAIVNGGNLTIADSTFADNSAPRDGGAIDNFGTMTVTGTTFVGNSAPATGGGVSGRTELGNGGAIQNAGPLAIADSTFAGNSAGSAGGAIDSIFATISIANSSLAGNTAGTFGGAISLNGPNDFTARGGTLVVTDSTISNNQVGLVSGEGYAGGIGVNDSTVRLVGTTVSGNASGRRAGGLGANGGDVSITGSTFSGNATGGDGGGMSINGGVSITGRGKTQGATLNVVNSTFEQNSAAGKGGGIESTSTTARIAGGSILDNAAGVDGGGISLDFDQSFRLTHGSLLITDSNIVGNTAARDGGGIANFDQLTLDTATITGNVAGRNGGGVANNAGLANHRSTIVGNAPDDVSGPAGTAGSGGTGVSTRG